MFYSITKAEKKKPKVYFLPSPLSFILLQDTLPTGRVSAWVVDGRVKFKSDEPPLLTCGPLQWDSEFRMRHWMLRPCLRAGYCTGALPDGRASDTEFRIHHSPFTIRTYALAYARAYAMGF